MSGYRFSVNDAFHYNNNPLISPHNMRNQLGYNNGNITYQVRPFPFSILSYNLALMVAPASYKGRNRERAKSQFIQNLIEKSPDIVGICEIFDNDERQELRNRLSPIYMHSKEGPDEADIESDGGLLLLSKHPFVSSHSSIYREAAGPDSLANKGILHARINPPNGVIPSDVFFTHAQNIEEDDGQEALYAQLSHLGYMVQAYSHIDRPAFIFGDLNIPGENSENYQTMLQRLGMPIDLWKTKHPNLAGYTNTTNNNFFEDPTDAPANNHRLDYILLKPGEKFFPVLKEIELLQWTFDDFGISDHFGLMAQFQNLLQARVDINGTISRIRIIISNFFCIETSGSIGDDEVYLQLKVWAQNDVANPVKSKSPVYDNIGNYDSKDTSDMNPAIWEGDPGNYLQIEVAAWEHDDLPSDDIIGTQSIQISRLDLLLHKDRNFHLSIPFLIQDGEYAVRITIQVS